MVTEETQELFMKNDGTIAETFSDYLADKDTELYTFATTCEFDKISEYIDHILYRLNELCSDLKYLYIVNDSNNSLLNAVVTLIRFFKSYTTDLVSMNILYLMDSRYYNMIKMINDIKLIEKTLIPNDSLNLSHKDFIETFMARITGKDKFSYSESVITNSSISQADKQKIVETQQYSANEEVKDKITNYDKMDNIIKQLFTKFNITYKDSAKYTATLSPAENLIKEMLIKTYSIFTNIDLPRDTKYLIEKVVYEVYLSIGKSTIDTHDSFRLEGYITNKEVPNYTEKIQSLEKTYKLFTVLLNHYSDVYSVLKTIQIPRDGITMRDNIRLVYEE
jgi:hypothetical protein